MRASAFVLPTTPGRRIHIGTFRAWLPVPVWAFVLPQARKIGDRGRMDGSLKGRLILIAEDEPLIALEITQAFENAGARVIRARTLNEALFGVEDPALSAAILDHALSDGDSPEICGRMTERNIPFVTYSGYDHLGCRGGIHVKKPASMPVLVATVKGLLAARQISH
jgi:CheY-like chemotaxis protein